MENDREIDSVMMNISRSGSSLIDVMVFSVKMSMAIATFLTRLAEKGLVASNISDSFKVFNKQSGGEFTVYNIPLSEEKAKTLMEMNQLELKLQNKKNPFLKISMRNEIKKMEDSIPELTQLTSSGISYCTLPKLNGSEQTIQVAIEKKDDQKFKSWFLNHLTSEMKGGQKSVEGIKVFTEGNYSILNMPFESAEDIEAMMSDFAPDKMGVNYAILPDLNIGDGYTQIVIPNSDSKQVELWFKLWKERALSEGREVRDMYSMNEDSYTSMGEVTQEQYIDMADKPYKEVQAEYEEKSVPVPWKQKLGEENSEEFVKYKQNDNYHMITINKETLVENQHKNSVAKKFEEEFGYFVSRIPGTYAENEQTLVIPAEQVFSTNDGKTFLAFLDKTKDYYKLDADGTLGKVTTEEIKKTYDNIKRSFDKVQSFREGKTLTQHLSPNLTNPNLETILQNVVKL